MSETVTGKLDNMLGSTPKVAKKAPVKKVKPLVPNTLGFNIGDEVQGLILSDMREDVGIDIVDRLEVVEKIIDDGDGFYYVETNFTKTLKRKINADNKKLKEDEDKMNVAWYVNSKANFVKVLNDIKESDLKKIGATIEGEHVVFEHTEIPKSAFLALKPFVEVMEDKEILETIDVEEEVLVVISGIEFTIADLKAIFGK